MLERLQVGFTRDQLERSVSDRFEQQVAKYPGRIAVKSKRSELTYEMFNQAANRVARAILARRREGPEAIALLLGNDALTIAAILGVLKAGKFYVPLGPSYPHDRAAYILRDSETRLIVTDDAHLARAEALASDELLVLNMDQLDPLLSSENLGLSISPEAFTWILYTSGSTGQPKGVVQTHRNVLHYIMTYTNELNIRPDDRFSLLFSFDVNGAAHEIFGALLNGASLYPFDIKAEGLAGLSHWFVEHRITMYCSVPTVFDHFLATLGEGEALPTFRVVKLIGEPVYRRHLEGYRKHFSPDCILVNRLGTTETGTVQWHFIDRETEVDGNLVPVGYPVADNDILLLDESGQEVPCSEIGEVAVESPYLSPGYWRKPELTRAAFLPSRRAGNARIFRTGDVGRLLPDGCLVHLGRRDYQVKIRGHRVEVGEVEAALLDLALIREGVVMGLAGPSGEQRLVAYLVPNRRPPPTVTALRRALARRLPEYMIPSAFVWLDALPLAPNGKVHRRALPPPGSARPELGTPFVAPRTPVEEVLAGIWAAVLGLEQVGVHDEFLALGGNSLLASQVVARLCDAFRMEAPLHDLLTAPTVADQARALVREEPAPGQVAAIARLRRQIAAMSDDERRARLRDAKEARAQRRTDRDDVAGEVTSSGEQDERAVRR